MGDSREEHALQRHTRKEKKKNYRMPCRVPIMMSPQWKEWMQVTARNLSPVTGERRITVKTSETQASTPSSAWLAQEEARP
eukprot:scaffold7812_cov24-Tisochrysis_lutea.AAC.1